MPKTIIFVVNDPDFFLSHRLPVALGAQEAGYEVHVATAAGPGLSAIKSHGLAHHALPLSRSGRNPFAELWSIAVLIRLFRALKPDLVHLVTIKPVLYGGLAARVARVPAMVAAISGLGSVFSSSEKTGVVRHVVEKLYKTALGHRDLRVIFQNKDDHHTLLAIGAIRPEQAALIRGSGADLNDYPYSQELEQIPVIVMAARLLFEKGVGIYMDAARMLRQRDVNARFQLVGMPDPGNPGSVIEDDLAAWEGEGLVELLGFRNDIAQVFANANIVILPSHYGEGLPKVLIEAAACGRAVITTDHPGCRDAITPDETGLLVPVRNANALADAIQYLIENPDRRQAMGRAGRKLAEEAFDVRQVVAAHLEIYEQLNKR